MSTATGVRVNPYIGPREFRDDEVHLFFGRTKEVLDLTRLLVAERIVLCHSPSGAGKTSLIRTTLHEQLIKRRFTTLPIIRVSQEMLPGIPATANRFVVSTLLCLEAFFPESEQLSLDKLGALSLQAYMAERLRAVVGTKRIVLIFDQFEEIILLDPLDLVAKRAFFQQLGDLLTDERVWALFAIREDYVASLEPFVEAIPGRLSSTYRLPLLELEPALEAIQKPAQSMGVTFNADAAAKLADDLRRMRALRADHTLEERLGPFIEPVQLQVVCFRLWERLAPDVNTISADDIETAFEGVDEALAGYYNEYVMRIARDTGASERLIRGWFNDRLITADGIRAQVRQGQEDSEGLTNTVVTKLIDAHLVRAERERGGIWLELAHDRLVEPIRRANSAWRKEHLSTLQQQASLWSEQGRPDGLLLRGQTLAEAEQWADANSTELTDDEGQFLRACRAARNRRRGFEVLGVFLVAATIVALFASYRASAERQIAEEQRAIAEEQRLIADGQRSTAVSEADNAQRAYANASTAQSLAITAQIRAESEASTAQAALSLVQTAQSQTETSANQQAAIRLAADQLAALDGGDPDHALALALGGLTAPLESPQLDLLLSRAADASGTRAVLPGDTNEVIGVAVSPDGQRAYTGDRAGVVRIWNIADGSFAGELLDRGGGVQEIAFSPDERLIGTASDDGTVSIWRADTGDLIKTLGPRNGLVIDFAFSPDNRTILAGNDNGLVHLWDIASGAEIKSFSARPALAFSIDGGSAIVVDASEGVSANTMALIDLATDSARVRFQGHERPIQDVILSADGFTLFSASMDGTIRIWDVVTGQQKDVLSGHTATVWAIDLSADGSRLLSSSADNTIRLWDVRTGTELRRYEGHIGSVYRAVFTPRGDQFVSVAEDGQGRIWDVFSRQELAVLQGAGDSLQDVAANPAGPEVIAASSDGAIYRWNRTTSASLSPLELGNTRIFAVDYSPDGLTIAVGFENGTVSVIPASGGAARWNARMIGEIQSVAYSPDGQYVVAGSTSGEVRLWSAADGTRVASFPKLSTDATYVTFRADSGAVAASSQDWSVRLWDVATQRELGAYKGHLAGVLSVAISPDGKTIASGGTDSQIILWDVATGSIEHRLVGHASAVWGVAFSPDGALLVSGSADRTVRVWDVEAGREIRRYVGHTQRVWSVTFAPDGGSVISASADRTVRIWRLESRQELIDWVTANRYIPPLTCDLKELYRLAGPCAESTVLELTPTLSP